MIKRCKIGCLTDRVARTFIALQKQQALSEVISYIKTSVFHIAFEVVITILYISPHVLYSSTQSDKECIELSSFFRYVGIISAYASICHNLKVKGKYPNELKALYK